MMQRQSLSVWFGAHNSSLVWESCRQLVGDWGIGEGSSCAHSILVHGRSSKPPWVNSTAAALPLPRVWQEVCSLSASPAAAGFSCRCFSGGTISAVTGVAQARTSSAPGAHAAAALVGPPTLCERSYGQEASNCNAPRLANLSKASRVAPSVTE